jgi:hypothetical protein
MVTKQTKQQINMENLNYRIDYCIWIGLYISTLLGGEFSNCHGQGRTPEEAYTSLKIRVNQLRCKRTK